MPKLLNFLPFLLIVIISTACNSAAVAEIEATATPTLTATVPPAPTTAETPTATPTPLPTQTPTPTTTPSLTPTPEPRLRRLTTGGCCVQPTFSADSQQILFIDKPDDNALTAIYGVSINPPETNPVLVSEIIGFRNHDRSLVATIENGDLLRLTREATGESWTINTKGNWPKFSPDGQSILWTARDEDGPYDQRLGEVWVAQIDGSQPRRALTTYGGGVNDWLDGQRFLLVSKPNPSEILVTLSVYDITTNQLTHLFTERQLREVRISTQGSWVAFYAMFTDDPTRSGLWLVSTDGQSQRQLDIPRFGAYRWQDDDTLIYIPMRAEGETSMQLWAIDAPTGQLTPLTNPQQLAFSIANGDWKVSPDGRHVAFVNSQDNNIWVIDLP